MKKFIILFCVALLGGCIEHSQSDIPQPKKPQQVELYNNDRRFNVWHDDLRKVTCWIFDGYRERSISCLPDSQLASSK
ncbi:MAG: hypothetical protein ACRC4V_11045 [Aeromonas veronii]